MKIRLEEWAYPPTRAHRNDAGLDLFTPIDLIINGGCSVAVDTGVAVAIPNGFFGAVEPKSGLLFKKKIFTFGTVDCGYTGTIRVILFNHGAQPVQFKAGDKIAQLIIEPCITPEIEIVDSLEKTERGDNGFGSSGWR